MKAALKIVAACVLVWVVWLTFVWSAMVMTDPDDQCNDTDSPAVARFVVCTIERK
jgi:hypothetical protein